MSEIVVRTTSKVWSLGKTWNVHARCENTGGWIRATGILTEAEANLRAAELEADLAREVNSRAERLPGNVVEIAKCPHGCKGNLKWCEDQYICPKCRDEWPYETIHGRYLDGEPVEASPE